MSPVPEISEARTEANRQNSRLSTGPKSDEGKAKVRLNGLRHGLTGNTVVMPYEDSAAYETFVAGILESLQPEGPAELDLARSVANGRWRLNRALAIEENVFALGSVVNPVQIDADDETIAALTQAQTFLQNAQQLQLLTLYSGRIDRGIRKNDADLKELQAARHTAYDKALEEAILLHQLSKANQESGLIPTDSDSEESANGHGFGFSKAFLDRHLDRQRRLTEARERFRPAAKPGRSSLRLAA